MNIDHILETLNSNNVKYLLIGGMSYFLRHKPQLTFDIDFWVENSEQNLALVEKSLSLLDSEWGVDDKSWKKVSLYSSGWIKSQSIFALSSPYGAIDIFTKVKGLNNWNDSFSSAVKGLTASGVGYYSINDEDLLK